MKFFEAIQEARAGHKISTPNTPCLIWDIKTNSIVALGSNTPLQFIITGDLIDNDNWKVEKLSHNFEWAVEQLRLGFAVRRIEWEDKDKSIFVWKEVIIDYNDHVYRFSIDDFKAEDWIYN